MSRIASDLADAGAAASDRSRPRAPTGLLVAAFVLMFSSTFGQTYFIAIFAPG